MANLKEISLLALLKALDTGVEPPTTGNYQIDNELSLFGNADTAGERFYLAAKKHYLTIVKYYLEKIPYQYRVHWISSACTYGIEKRDQWMIENLEFILDKVPKIDLLVCYVRVKDLVNVIKYTDEVETDFGINLYLNNSTTGLLVELSSCGDLSILKACSEYIDVFKSRFIRYLIESFISNQDFTTIQVSIDGGIIRSLDLLKFTIDTGFESQNKNIITLVSLIRSTYFGDISLKDMVKTINIPLTRDMMVGMVADIDYIDLNVVKLVNDADIEPIISGLLNAIDVDVNKYPLLKSDRETYGVLFSNYLYQGIMSRKLYDFISSRNSTKPSIDEDIQVNNDIKAQLIVDEIIMNNIMARFTSIQKIMEAVPNLPQNWWKFNSYNIYVDENEINMIKRDIQSPVFNLAGFNFPAQQAPAQQAPAQLLQAIQPPVLNGGFNFPAQLLQAIQPPLNLGGFNFPAQQAPAPIRPPAQLLPVLQPPVFNLGGFNLQPPPGNN